MGSEGLLLASLALFEFLILKLPPVPLQRVKMGAGLGTGRDGAACSSASDDRQPVNSCLRRLD